MLSKNDSGSKVFETSKQVQINLDSERQQCIACTSFREYSPCCRSQQSHGGFSQLMRNHQRPGGTFLNQIFVVSILFSCHLSNWMKNFTFSRLFLYLYLASKCDQNTFYLFQSSNLSNNFTQLQYNTNSICIFEG